MFKIMKERNILVRHLNEALRLSVGVERLIYFAYIFSLLSHITSCLWYLLAKLEGLNPTCWIYRYEFQDYSNFQVFYLFFFIT
jgi:hypothetical protein